MPSTLCALSLAILFALVASSLTESISSTTLSPPSFSNETETKSSIVETEFNDSKGRSFMSNGDDNHHLQRQSRIINDEKISIKGFIPIVGLSSNDDEKKSSSSENQYMSSVSNSNERNYYQQESVNHPSPYDDRNQLININSFQDVQPPHNVQPEDQRFIGSALQGLIGAARPGGLMNAISGLNNFARPQQTLNRKIDCICVPFYLCRNGYITGNGLSNRDFDHISSSQYQQRKNDLPIEDPYSAINERSLDATNNVSLTINHRESKIFFIYYTYRRNMPNKFLVE